MPSALYFCYSVRSIAVRLFLGFLRNAFDILETRGLQPKTKITTFVLVETVRHGIKVAGGTTTAITPIQMVCTRAEVTHKVLHGSHFEDKDIL